MRKTVFFVIFLVLAIVPAFADSVIVNFPAAGDTYTSNSGSGTIQPGGDTGSMWLAGHSVTSPVFDVSLTSVNSLTENWTFFNVLNNAYGGSATWNILLNGTLVGSETILGCDSYCNEQQTLQNTIFFSGILPVNGGYQLALVLQNNVALGGGSMVWLDGGTTTLSDSDSEAVTPEPSSILLLATGLAALLLLARKSLTA